VSVDGLKPSNHAWRYLGWAVLIEALVVAAGWAYYLHAHPRLSDVFAFCAVGLLTFGIALQSYNLGRTRDVEAERMNFLKQQARPSSQEQSPGEPAAANANVSPSPNIQDAAQGQTTPGLFATTGIALKPGYAYLLAVALFGLAVALHEPPPRTTVSQTDITLTPSPLPPTPAASSVPLNASATPSGMPTPTSTPSLPPMKCQATLQGPDTLTPGGASAYDVQVHCPRPAATAPDVDLSAAWTTPNPVANYSAVSGDGGSNFNWRFIAVVTPVSNAATGASGNDVHSLLFSTIKSNPSKAYQPSPDLIVTIRQDRTLDSLKTAITSAGGAISALLALITGLWAFLKGERPPTA
jgi:hypothetical protein